MSTGGLRASEEKKSNISREDEQKIFAYLSSCLTDTKDAPSKFSEYASSSDPLKIVAAKLATHFNTNLTLAATVEAANRKIFADYNDVFITILKYKNDVQNIVDKHLSKLQKKVDDLLIQCLTELIRSHRIETSIYAAFIKYVEGLAKLAYQDLKEGADNLKKTYRRDIDQAFIEQQKALMEEIRKSQPSLSSLKTRVTDDLEQTTSDYFKSTPGLPEVAKKMLLAANEAAISALEKQATSMTKTMLDESQSAARHELSTIFSARKLQLFEIQEIVDETFAEQYSDEFLSIIFQTLNSQDTYQALLQERKSNTNLDINRWFDQKLAAILADSFDNKFFPGLKKIFSADNLEWRKHLTRPFVATDQELAAGRNFRDCCYSLFMFNIHRRFAPPIARNRDYAITSYVKQEKALLVREATVRQRLRGSQT